MLHVKDWDQPTPAARLPSWPGETALLPKDSSSYPLIYPPADVRARFYTITAGNAEQVRERTRLWTTVKTGR